MKTRNQYTFVYRSYWREIDWNVVSLLVSVGIVVVTVLMIASYK